jgi:class 3 adenylate cyclase/tetratricopeptide (TPR) repeat protein
LPASCPACGFANLAGEKFCGGCGAGLQQDAGQASPPEPLQPELRPATVLFADLVGFTALSNRTDTEALQSWLDRFFERADAEVVRFGGTVDKHIGDGLMAVFGAPVAHDNDPERAALCAEALHALSLSAPDGSGPVLLHIGIAAGTVMASPSGSSLHRAYTVTGPSVNLAARLCELSAPGESLVSGPVADAVGEGFEVERKGAIEVAGFDAPVPAWRVRGRKQETLRARASSPLVGRKRELGQFAALLETCRSTGSGQVVVLRGEAGIGKSRLVEAVEEIARGRGFKTAKASIVDFGGGRERDPTRLLAAALLGVPGGADEAARRAGLERAGADGFAAGAAKGLLAALLDLPLEDEARSLYDAMPPQARTQATERLLSELVAAAAERNPRLLIVEDVHWADPAMLGRFAAIGSPLADKPGMLLVTTRVEGDPLGPGWRSRIRGTPVLTIDLAPLSRSESLSLAGALVGRSGADFGALADRAEGNPLFLVQLARHADETLGSGLPRSIQSLVLARADRLAPEQKRLLQTAAVLGQRFTLDVLQHLSEQPSASVDTLVAQGLMRPSGADMTFAHALVHEAIYASLPRVRREALHRRAAEWYSGRDAGLHAQHLGRANDPTAAAAFLEAAAQARASYRLEDALRLAEEGAGAAGSEQVRFRLALDRGALLHDLGRIEEATRSYESAQATAEQPADRCRAQIGLAAAMRVSDRIEDALAVLETAEAAAASLEMDGERSRIHYLRGSLYFPRARVKESRAEHERALEFARRAGSAELEALALSGLGDAYYAEGRMRSAADAFDRCVALAREHGLGRIELANLPMLAFTRFFIGEVRPALAVGRSAAATARRVGARRGEIIAHHVLFTAHFELAELDEAQAALDGGHAAAIELKARRFEAESTAFMAQLARIRGDRASAVRWARQALAIARETGIDYVGGVILGELAAASDDAAEREQAIEEGLALLARGGLAHNHLWFYRTMIESDLERGNWAALGQWADGLEAVTREEPLTYTDLLVRLARAARRRDRTGSADLADVAVEFEQLGFVYLAGLARGAAEA